MTYPTSVRSTDPLRIVIAPDSFKGTLGALDVARAIAAGWRSIRPDDSISLIPQADGGEGTLDAIEAAVAGTIRRSAGDVTGPDGRSTPGEWLELPNGTAVVELAQMCGLSLMQSLDPLGASTVGLGEVITAALAHGASKLVIALGGSASTDAAAGALAALGLRSDGTLSHGGAPLARIRSVDASGLTRPPSGGVVLLTDVAAPLFGPAGAAAMFGPQKGASSTQVSELDSAIAHFAGLLGGDAQQPGTGAAGGAGYGFSAAWGATIEPGARYLASLSGLPAAVASAHVLVTGEGRFDRTSGAGKLVGELIHIAAEGNARIGIIAGQVDVQPVDENGTALWYAALAELAGSVDNAINDPARWLEAAGAAAAAALDH